MPPIATPLPLTYRAQPGRFDELVDGDGVPRERWQRLIGLYLSLGQSDLERRRDQADRLLTAEGASHVVHEDGESTPRAWRLDPIPYVIDAADFVLLSRGLAQRARLLNAVLADLYGPRRLLSEGIVPAELVLGYPGYVRVAWGVQPVGGRHLAVYGADIVRDDQGRFLVLRDHTDAPSGAGYALLHRAVLSRLFPDQYRQLRIARLDGFFRQLRDALGALAPDDRRSPRTVVLTPGVRHPHYVEHSYLATQLGYHLVEGADLTVRGGRVWLRSLGGLEAVDVMLRRVDDIDADPLEVSPRGEGGVPGLVQAWREGQVGLANGVGSGTASHLGLAPYLAGACEALLGEPLLLGSIATSWCGDRTVERAVLGDLAGWVLHDTSPVNPRRSAFGRRLTASEAEAWRTAIAAEPLRYVAQHEARLATTPQLRAGAITPGVSAVRMLAVAGPGDDWTVLPGGLARVVQPDTPIVNQVRGLAKDVWVLEETGRRRESTGRRPRALPQVDLRASLPTRTAEALFWIGRNAERAEGAARYARTLVDRCEQDPALMTTPWLPTVLDGLRAVSGGTGWRRGGATAGATTNAPPPDELRPEVAAALGERPGGIGDALGHLVANTSSVRGFLSTATWSLVSRLNERRLALPVAVAKDDLFELSEQLEGVVISLTAFSGLVAESMVRGPGWRFLDLGRRIERSLLLCNVIEATLAVVPDADLAQPIREVVLASCESLVVYRRRYRSDPELSAMLDLLLADDSNPRALAFQLDRIAEDLHSLPGRPATDAHLALVEEAGSIVVGTSWGAVTAPPPGAGTAPTGATVGSRLSGLDGVVLDVRGRLLSLADQVVDEWFAHADARRLGTQQPPLWP